MGRVVIRILRIRRIICVVAGVFILTAVGAKQSGALAGRQCEDLSRNGHAYSYDIAELRIYRSRGSAGFYPFARLLKEPLIFRTGDKAVIKRILASMQIGPRVGDLTYCDRLLSSFRLHVVTLYSNGKVFGYVQVAPKEAVIGAPSDFGTCASVRNFEPGDCGMSAWVSYEFFGEMETLGLMEIIEGH